MKPGQRPVRNVSTNRMPLAKPSSSLHASRLVQEELRGYCCKCCETSDVERERRDFDGSSKSTAKMFARDRFEKIPPNESQQLDANGRDVEANDNDNDGEEKWNPFPRRREDGGSQSI